MKTKLNKYCRTLTISFDHSSIQKTDQLQTLTLLDRSNVLRIILHQITPAQFAKMCKAEIKSEKNKQLIKTKLNFSNEVTSK